MLWETFKLALQAILRNPTRSFLTVLGVVIGVAAVIAMVTIGKGSTAQVTADVERMGANLMILSPGQMRFGPGSGGGSERAFDLGDVDRIIDQVASVETAAPSGNASLVAVFGNTNYQTRVTGTDSRYLLATDWPVATGRGFATAEESAGKPVCLLGETVRDELFGQADPIGERIRLGAMSCQVIGVLGAKGASSFGTDQDDVVLIPFKTFGRRIAGSMDVGTIYISVRDGYSVDRATNDITALMRELRRIGPGEEDDFSLRNMEQVASMLNSVNTVLTGLLSAVAAVSLLVGGIGIMNIMLVSVTERTREIGIRMAVGAQAGQVLLQFLVEAIVLSALGGVLGVALGLGLAAVGAQLLNVPFTPDPGTIALAFAFSAMVGVVFGYFPARRAARLDPIEALRH
ncbi:ABC transporter permease [Rhodovulum adriaticum]|uniref:Putative ABC transport system permease protein n=1 Tax=Rhodovulum adriaticum TaxID=35804 RepID=A0A4R2NMJ5_RHOAD|nr:ABC transporter permease [Rhodovulum adriaticum]MBK1635771.1 multidrug ABC transporter substrate-binding protein [Rhodovulum adriaticum]TCP22508.1 putative ABC transport system permease protein [Rhodovulum adriaticum]